MDDLELEALLAPRQVHAREVASLDGLRVGFLSLTRRDLVDETLAARASVSGSPDGFELHAASPETKRRIVLRSCVSEDGRPFFASLGEVLELPSHVVEELVQHALSVSRLGTMTGEQTKQIFEHAVLDVELLRARYACELVAFWGVPSARHASEAQVIYFFHARQKAVAKLDPFIP